MKIIYFLINSTKSNFSLFFFTLLLAFVNFIVYFFKGSANGIEQISVFIFHIFASFAHASVVTIALYALFFLVPLIIFRKPKISICTYTIAAIVFQIILLIDINVFSLYKYHLNSEILTIVLNQGTGVFVFGLTMWLKFIGSIILIAILPYLLFLKLKKYIDKWFSPRKMKVISTIVASCATITLVGFVISLRERNENFEICMTHLPFLETQPVKMIITKLGLNPLTELEILLFQTSMHDIHFPANELVASDSASNYNIIYILIDSWNPSTFDEDNTKNIYNFWKEKANYFNSHYSSGNGTVGSTYGIFWGIPRLYELETRPNKIYPPLVEELYKHNYNVETFASANFNFAFMSDMVFGRFPNVKHEVGGKTIFESDQLVTKQSIDFLKAQEKDKPFFAFLFYDLPHSNKLPKSYVKRYEPSWNETQQTAYHNNFDRTQAFNLYKNCVYHTDSLIGKVLETLESQNLLQNTVVVITGDHGEEFNENKKNYWGHGSNYSDWQIKIPFIFYYPGISAGNKFEHATTHYDISPTILSRFFSIQNPLSDYSFGKNLYDTVSRYPHITNHMGNENAIITKDKIISIFPQKGLYKFTDRNLNDLDKSTFSVDSLKELLKKQNQFFTKDKQGYYY